MRTKVASFFIFFQELSNKKEIKALRPKMTKIASREGGDPALNCQSCCQKLQAVDVHCCLFGGPWSARLEVSATGSPASLGGVRLDYEIQIASKDGFPIPARWVSDPP